MQFKVPQFIDIEDKIFGPLTLKQFMYVLGAGGFAFLFWKFIPIKIIAILLILPVSGFFLALAFVKVNERPFIDFVESAFRFMTSSKVYVWKQPTPKAIEKDLAPLLVETTKEVLVKKTKEDRLHQIAFGLDVLDKEDTSSQEKRVE